jgi:hypothetical protein
MVEKRESERVNKKELACRGWAAMVETSSPTLWGCCRSSGRRQRFEASARIPCVGGRCRNVARAITTYRFGLWAVGGVPSTYSYIDHDLRIASDSLGIHRM